MILYMGYNIEVIPNVVLEEQKLSNINTIVRLSKLLNECFDIFPATKLNITNIYKGYDFFLCNYKSKIIGLAAVKIENHLSTYSDSNIQTYNTIKYVLKENKVFDKEAKRFINSDSKYYNVPMITSLCKDKEYKNVGCSILNFIEKYYRKKGITKIYLVAGSNRNYNVLKNAHMFNNTDSINKYNKLYKQDNENLIKYYNKNGYNILDNYYDYDYIKLEDGDTIITFFNTLCKNI